MKTKNVSLECLRENEELFHITFEQAAVGIAHVSPEGKFIRINQKFCDIVKYSKDEMLSFRFQDITHVDDLKEDLQQLEKLLKGDIKTFVREKRYICKDKTIVWVNLTVSLVRDIKNKPKFIVVFVQDITERKSIENALAESESRYKNIIENTTDIIIVTGFDGKHLYVSSRYQELLGRTPKQIDKILIEYIHPDDQTELKKLYIESFQKKYAPAPDTEFEFRIQHQDGHYIWVSSISKNYYNENGKIVGIITSLRDIRKRKETEERLQQSELRYKNIIENITEAITVVDFNGKAIYTSPTHDKLTGRGLIEVNELPINYIHPEDRLKLIDLYEKSFMTHQVAAPNTEFEYRILHKNGSYRWFSSLSNNYYDENGNIIGIITSMRDISKRKEMEENLKNSEQKYRHLFESSPYIIGLINKNGTIIDCNSSVSNVFSSRKEDLIGRTIYEVFSKLEENKDLIPNFQNLIDEAYSEIQGKSFEFKLYISSGQFVWLNVESSFTEIENQLLIQFIMQDITEKKIIEENLKESETKFRTISDQSFLGISILQNGIFKYYNNKMTEINGYNREDIQDWEPYEYLKIIHPDDREEATVEAKKNEKGETHVLTHSKYRIITKSGEIRWTESFSKPINFEGRTADLIMSKDITEEVLADIKLKESELKFRTIAEQSFLGISILQNGIFKYYNDKMTEINGYSREDIQNWGPYEYLKIIHPDNQEEATVEARKSELGNTDYVTASKYRVITKSGEIRWTESFSKPITYEGKNADLVMSKDITEEVLADMKLKESESKFRTIAEQSFMGIIIIQDGEFKYFNQRAADINGHSVEEIKKWEPYEFMKLIHPEDNDFVLEQVKKKQKGDKNVINRYKYRLIKKSGEVAWMDNYSKTITFNGRSADLVMTEDITEKILSEQQLKESELKFRKIFEANPSGMHLFDLNQDDELVFKGANPAADKILKRNNRVKIGLTFKEVFPELVKTDIPLKYKNVALNGESLNWEHTYKNNNGINRTYDIYAFQTAPRRIVSSFLDITDRIEAEQRLREVNKLKSDLLRRASHELKTPLTSINGAVDLLLTTYQEDFSDKSRKFLQIIKDGSVRLENLIKDLLNVSRLNAQDVEIHKDNEDIVKLMRNSIKEVDIFAFERNIEINFNQVESVYINVDKNKILQVFANILMNAIKYTPPLGKVTVLLDVHQDIIEYFIRDTGIGFTEEEKNGLFKQFGKIERFGHGYELNTEGSGLGLYISKELVELHSGELLLESEGRNKGSTFIIRLPKF